MIEMESPLEHYADGLGFHFGGYLIWRFLWRRVGDALSLLKQHLISVSYYFIYFMNYTILQTHSIINNKTLDIKIYFEIYLKPVGNFLKSILFHQNFILNIYIYIIVELRSIYMHLN